jgi:hypothetical protein
VNLYPLPLPDLPQPAPVDTGWARAIRHGPMTVEQVLDRARAEMAEQDRQEAMAADPVAWLRAHRPRRLIDRLLGR